MLSNTQFRTTITEFLATEQLFFIIFILENYIRGGEGPPYAIFRYANCISEEFKISVIDSQISTFP